MVRRDHARMGDDLRPCSRPPPPAMRLFALAAILATVPTAAAQSDVVTFWASFQDAVRDGDMEAVGAHLGFPFSQPHVVPSEDIETLEDFEDSLLAWGLEDNEELRAALLEVEPGDLRPDGDGYAFRAVVRSYNEYVDMTHEIALVGRIEGVAPGTYRLVSLGHPDA